MLTVHFLLRFLLFLDHFLVHQNLRHALRNFVVCFMREIIRLLVGPVCKGEGSGSRGELNVSK